MNVRKVSSQIKSCKSGTTLVGVMIFPFIRSLFWATIKFRLKVSYHISLCGLHRLICDDSLLTYIKPRFPRARLLYRAKHATSKKRGITRTRLRNARCSEASTQLKADQNIRVTQHVRHLPDKVWSVISHVALRSCVAQMSSVALEGRRTTIKSTCDNWSRHAKRHVTFIVTFDMTVDNSVDSQDFFF